MLNLHTFRHMHQLCQMRIAQLWSDRQVHLQSASRSEAWVWTLDGLSTQIDAEAGIVATKPRTID
jgi:hypothetical protein